MKPFEGILGNTCELRIVEFLLPLEDMAFNITELAEEVGVSRPTVIKAVKVLQKWGLLSVVQKLGNMKTYTLNRASPYVKLLNEFNNQIIADIAGIPYTPALGYHFARSTEDPGEESQWKYSPQEERGSWILEGETSW